MTQPEKLGEGFLELRGKTSCGQPEIQRAVHQVDNLLGIEDAAGARNWRLTWHEGLGGKSKVVVLANQLTNVSTQPERGSSHERGTPCTIGLSPASLRRE